MKKLIFAAVLMLSTSVFAFAQEPEAEETQATETVETVDVEEAE